MTSKWTILDTGKNSAKRNMELDIKLLQDLSTDSQTPILHLYEWERPCATYGHFIDPALYLQMDLLDRIPFELAKRPTGGGVIFHVADYAFSILVPCGYGRYSVNTLDNYAFVNSLVIKVIESFTAGKAVPSLLPLEDPPFHPYVQRFCMAKPTKFDVMVHGRKVAGGAQRRTRFGFLHQGSLSLAVPDMELLESVLHSKDEVIRAMCANTHALLPGNPCREKISEARLRLRGLFKKIILEQGACLEQGA